MKTLITKKVFDGGQCTTLIADPSMVAMRDPHNSQFVFQKFIGNGRGWETIRPMTEDEINELMEGELK